MVAIELDGLTKPYGPALGGTFALFLIEGTYALVGAGVCVLMTLVLVVVNQIRFATADI